MKRVYRGAGVLSDGARETTLVRPDPRMRIRPHLATQVYAAISLQLPVMGPS